MQMWESKSKVIPVLSYTMCHKDISGGLSTASHNLTSAHNTLQVSGQLHTPAT